MAPAVRVPKPHSKTQPHPGKKKKARKTNPIRPSETYAAKIKSLCIVRLLPLFEQLWLAKRQQAAALHRSRLSADETVEIGSAIVEVLVGGRFPEVEIDDKDAGRVGEAFCGDIAAGVGNEAQPGVSKRDEAFVFV